MLFEFFNIAASDVVGISDPGAALVTEAGSFVCAAAHAAIRDPRV